MLEHEDFRHARPTCSFITDRTSLLYDIDLYIDGHAVNIIRQHFLAIQCTCPQLISDISLDPMIHQTLKQPWPREVPQPGNTLFRLNFHFNKVLQPHSAPLDTFSTGYQVSIKSPSRIYIFLSFCSLNLASLVVTGLAQKSRVSSWSQDPHLILQPYND